MAPELDGGLLESGLLRNGECKEEGTHSGPTGTTSSSSPSSSVTARKRSETLLLRWKATASMVAGRALAHLHEVFLGTKLFPLFSAVPLAVVAESCSLGRAWVFAFSLIGLAPLAERVSFLSEQVAHSAGPTAGGLLNATCGNVPELIIALLALHKDKIDVLKWSLLGSILSNLLLVLGSSLLFGGLANMHKERPFDRRQADVSIGLLMLAVLCFASTTISKNTISTGDSVSASVSLLQFSRSSGIVMLIAYFGGLLFQLKTHRQIFGPQEDGSDSNDDDIVEAPVIGFASAIIWLIGMTAVIAILSDYIVTTIEDASHSWGLPVRFTSIILLPVVGNAAEHAGAIIFAFKNKLDITLGVALGSATQIALLVIPVSLVVAWVKDVRMDLDFKLLETGSLVMTVLTTAFTLQDEKWQYMKGLILLFCYIVIAMCFYTNKDPPCKCHIKKYA